MNIKLPLALTLIGLASVAEAKDKKREEICTVWKDEVSYEVGNANKALKEKNWSYALKKLRVLQCIIKQDPNLLKGQKLLGQDITKEQIKNTSFDAAREYCKNLNMHLESLMGREETGLGIPNKDLEQDYRRSIRDLEKQYPGACAKPKLIS